MAGIAGSAGARRTVLAAAAVAAGVGLVAPFGTGSAYAGAATVSAVTGTWQEIVPVLTTDYRPSAATATTGMYQGVGSTLWQGTWNGVTDYTISGVANLVTGEGNGTIHETFNGRSADGTSGSLGFVETYVVDGSGHIRIDARIVRSAGGFTGSRGEVTFVGTQDGVATGNGTFAGTWIRPRHAPPGGLMPAR